MSRKNLYISASVAALSAYIFNLIAFTGTLNLLRAVAFIAMFLVVMAGFEKFVDWAETLDN